MIDYCFLICASIIMFSSYVVSNSISLNFCLKAFFFIFLSLYCFSWLIDEFFLIFCASIIMCSMYVVSNSICFLFKSFFPYSLYFLSPSVSLAESWITRELVKRSFLFLMVNLKLECRLVSLSVIFHNFYTIRFEVT